MDSKLQPPLRKKKKTVKGATDRVQERKISLWKIVSFCGVQYQRAARGQERWLERDALCGWTSHSVDRWNRLTCFNSHPQRQWEGCACMCVWVCASVCEGVRENQRPKIEGWSVTVLDVNRLLRDVCYKRVRVVCTNSYGNETCNQSLIYHYFRYLTGQVLSRISEKIYKKRQISHVGMWYCINALNVHGFTEYLKENLMSRLQQSNFPFSP